MHWHSSTAATPIMQKANTTAPSRYQSIQLNPSYANAFSNRGNTYATKGQYDRAIEDYNEAIRLNPKHADAFYNRGTAHNAKVNTTAPSRITAKRSGLIRTTQMRSTTVATPITPKANSTAPSRISTKRSGLIRTTQRRSKTAAPPITAKANTIEPSRISTKRSASIRTWR